MENTMLFGDVTMLGGDNFFFSDLDAFLMSPSSSSSSIPNYDSQLQGALTHIDAMENNDVLTWSSEDCYRWAQRVCQEQCLDAHTLNLDFFYSVTGSTLAQYSRYDFCAYFNNMWGGVFYDQFHQLLAHAGVAVSFPTSDYDSASSISSSYSDCSSSDSSTSSSASPYYENDDNAADLWDMPPLHVSEDITDLDSFLHQQVPQQQDLLEQENLLLKDIGDAALVEKEHQMNLFLPEMPVIKDEVEQLSFYENTRDTSSSPEPVVPSCGSLTSCESLTSCGSLNSCKALEKIRTKSRKRERGPKNWEFVIRLLADRQYNPEVVRWEDKTCGTFRFVRPSVIAQMWGKRSNKPNLSYDNFARGLRYHYTTGALRPVSERQLVYQCGPKALSFLAELLQ